MNKVRQLSCGKHERTFTSLTGEPICPECYKEFKSQSARIAELEAALRGLLAVSCPPRTCGDNCRYCDETSGHTAECEYGKAEQAAQKALGGE